MKFLTLAWVIRSIIKGLWNRVHAHWPKETNVHVYIFKTVLLACFLNNYYVI